MHFMEELIKRYFWKGYKYDEIVLLLEKRHHVQIRDMYIGLDYLEKNFTLIPFHC